MNFSSSIRLFLTFILIIISAIYAVAGQRTAPQARSVAVDKAPPTIPNASGSDLHRREWRYTIHPSDVLDLTFMLTPEFNQTVTVQPDGYITLRNAGPLLVVGQTIAELTDSVKTAYAGILHNPVVSVETRDFEKPYYVVGGQVGRPGKFDWRGEVTLTQAIEIAGGFTDAAKHSQVMMFRRVSDQWASAKLINVKQMLNAGNLSEDPILEPGDMLYVPKNAISKIKPFMPLPSIGTYYPF